MWPNDRQQTGRKFATYRLILVAKAKILVANVPVSVAISSPGKRKQLWRKMKNNFVAVDLLKVVLGLKSMEVI